MVLIDLQTDAGGMNGGKSSQYLLLTMQTARPEPGLSASKLWRAVKDSSLRPTNDTRW